MTAFVVTGLKRPVNPPPYHHPLWLALVNFRLGPHHHHHKHNHYDALLAQLDFKSSKDAKICMLMDLLRPHNFLFVGWFWIIICNLIWTSHVSSGTDPLFVIWYFEEKSISMSKIIVCQNISWGPFLMFLKFCFHINAKIWKRTKTKHDKIASKPESIAFH